MGIFDEVGRRVRQGVGAVSVGGALTGAAKLAVGKFAPRYFGPASQLLNGDPIGAALTLAKSKIGSIESLLGSNLLFQTMRNPLLGGITPSEAQRIHTQGQKTQYAKRNLWFLEIVDFYPDGARTEDSDTDVFNMFATGVSIPSYSASGESRPIGSGSMDYVSGRERVDLRITTYDDAAGTVKAWFKSRAERLTLRDGTVGVPGDYLVQIRVLHAAINDEVANIMGGYEEKWIMRPTSLETELSRSENGLEEVAMSFSQFDTFMYAGRDK